MLGLIAKFVDATVVGALTNTWTLWKYLICIGVCIVRVTWPLESVLNNLLLHTYSFWAWSLRTNCMYVVF